MDNPLQAFLAVLHARMLAGLGPLEHQRRVVRSPGVDGRAQPGDTRPRDDHASVFDVLVHVRN